MRSFVSTKPVMTSDTKMIEEQINDTMAFLNSYEDYRVHVLILLRISLIYLYSNHLDQLEKSLEDKKKKVLREIELVTELDDMEKQLSESNNNRQ